MTMFGPGKQLRRNTFAQAMMMESAAPAPHEPEPAVDPEIEPAVAPVEPEEQEITESALFESMDEDTMLEAVSRAADISMRSDAAAAVLQWVEEGDAEADAFEAMAYGLAGGEDDTELTDEQAEEFEKILGLMADFCLQLGATSENVQGMIDDDDDASEAVYTAVESALEGQDSDELVADFGVRENLIMEAMKKVVRNGQVVTIKTKKKKRRMTSAQRSALKKARQKAHSSAAKARRRKARNIRKSRGL